MNSQQANAMRHTDGSKRGRLPRFLSFIFEQRQPLTEHRPLFTLFTFLLLAAFAPRAEATWAKGGTVTNYNENGTNFTAHVFTTVGTNLLEFGVGGTVEYLVVGGGGSGACIQNNWGSGGGGAGGLLTGSTTVQAQVYAIVVGAGGPAQGQVNPGLPGQVSSFTNSSMTNLVAIGGGYGGSGGGGNGGSGGGGGTFGGAGGTGTAPQGYDGGYCVGGQSGFGGGGGGAGSVGVSNTAPINPAYGGTGVYVSAFSRWGDASYLGWFGGGGGGSKGNGSDYGRGGKGGGGNAGQGGTAAISGQANTGGGGGGAGGTSAAGAGGSGIVIVRYVTPSSDPQQWMKITLAGYTNQSETLTNFPVLVVLSNNVGNSGFTYDRFLSTFGTNATAVKRGDDLRFVANLADTNGFPYEIESWNTNGASYIWVQVPTIPGDGSGVIWAKWGYPAWLWGTNTPAAAWTNGFAIVAHMPETSGTVYDSTTNKNNGTTAGGTVQGAAGVIGNGQTFDGGDDSTTFGTTARPKDNFTYSAWVKTTEGLSLQAEQNGSGYNGLNFENSAFQRQQNPLGNNANAGSGAAVGTNGIEVSELADAYCPALVVYGNNSMGTNWNYVTVVYTNKQPTIYLNGLYGRTRYASGKTPYAPYQIGVGMPGSMDEVRVSAVSRSTNWIWAEYLNMASNTVFDSYAATVIRGIAVGATSNGFGTTVFVNTTITLTNTVSGGALSDNITVTVGPSPVFSISTDNVNFASGPFTLATNAAGDVPVTPIYIRFTPTTPGAYSGAITNISGSVTQLVTLTGTAIDPQPLLHVSTPPLDFGNVITNKTSITNTYDVWGEQLTNNVTVTAPSDYFQIATNDGAFGQVLNLTTNADRSLSTTTIKVRLIPSAGAGSAQYQGSITNASPGADNQTVAVAGTGVVQTVYVAPAGTLDFGIVTQNYTKVLSYTVSGSNLEDNVVVTAPSSAFTVSTNSGSGFGQSCTVLVAGASAPSGTNLAATTVYARFAPTLVQAYTGSITNASTGATNVLKAVSSGTVVEDLRAFAGGDSHYWDGATQRWVAIFTTTGTVNITVTKGIEAELLVVGGGGAGGGAGGYGGGGGAGGLIYYGPETNGHPWGTGYTVARGTYTVTVGAGGAPGSGTPSLRNGGNSRFGSAIASGGGGGGENTTGNTNGAAGGSGGGGLFGGIGGSGSNDVAVFQGNRGGNAAGGSGAGGGGAGKAGTDSAAQGGDGLRYSISGTLTWYAGGGGGAGGGPTSGGQGGGGASPSAGSNGTSGTNGLGGGGGGSWQNTSGGAGGSGIVILRYVIPPLAGTVFLFR